MNQQERNFVADMWTTLAAMFGRDLSKPVLKMMVDAVEDLPYEKVMLCLANWTKTSKQARAPFPAEIRDQINPVMNDRDVANDMARKIDKLVIKRGYWWAHGVCVGEDERGQPLMKFEGKDNKMFDSFKEAMVSEIGDVGYAVVRARGGWEATQASSNGMEEGQFIAQMRDQVESTLRLGRAGIDTSKLELPEPTNDRVLKLVDLAQKKLI